MKTKEELIEQADKELDEAIEACYLEKFRMLHNDMERTVKAAKDAREALEKFKSRDPDNVYVESLSAQPCIIYSGTNINC